MPFAQKSLLMWIGLIALTINPIFAAGLDSITVGPAVFQVQMYETPEQRERGLMFRRELPPNQGMLFVQPTGRAAFWMKNTYPARSAVFRPDGTLLQIEANALPCQTPDCPVYTSRKATVRYILEINAGAAARWHPAQRPTALQLSRSETTGHAEPRGDGVATVPPESAGRDPHARRGLSAFVFVDDHQLYIRSTVIRLNPASINSSTERSSST